MIISDRTIRGKAKTPPQSTPREAPKTTPHLDLIFADNRDGRSRRKSTALDAQPRFQEQRKRGRDRRQAPRVESNDAWWLKRNYVNFESFKPVEFAGRTAQRGREVF